MARGQSSSRVPSSALAPGQDRSRPHFRQFCARERSSDSSRPDLTAARAVPSVNRRVLCPSIVFRRSLARFSPRIEPCRDQSIPRVFLYGTVARRKTTRGAKIERAPTATAPATGKSGFRRPEDLFAVANCPKQGRQDSPQNAKALLGTRRDLPQNARVALGTRRDLPRNARALLGTRRDSPQNARALLGTREDLPRNARAVSGRRCCSSSSCGCCR